MLYLLSFGVGVAVGLFVAGVGAASRELGAEDSLPNLRTGNHRGGDQYVPPPKPAPMPNAPPPPAQRLVIEHVCRRCGKEWRGNGGGEG